MDTLRGYNITQSSAPDDGHMVAQLVFLIHTELRRTVNHASDSSYNSLMVILRY